MDTVAQTEAGNGQDHIDSLIERAQDVIDSFERGRSHRTRTSEEVLAMLGEVVDRNEGLGREMEAMRRNGIHLAGRLDATERREEEHRSRGDAAERREEEHRIRGDAAEERLKALGIEMETLRDQHARLTQAFDDFLATLGDGARSLQDEDKRFVAATALARSRATYGLPDGRSAQVPTEPNAGAFDGLLRRVAEEMGDEGRRPPVARLTADEG